jgi:hypothetical protein
MAMSSGDGCPSATTAGWLDMPVRQGEFVIIVGDMLERYTNGVLRATPHRVRGTEEEQDGSTAAAGTPPACLSPPPHMCWHDPDAGSALRLRLVQRPACAEPAQHTGAAMTDCTALLDTEW